MKKVFIALVLLLSFSVTSISCKEVPTEESTTTVDSTAVETPQTDVVVDSTSLDTSSTE